MLKFDLQPQDFWAASDKKNENDICNLILEIIFHKWNSSNKTVINGEAIEAVIRTVQTQPIQSIIFHCTAHTHVCGFSCQAEMTFFVVAD